MVKKENGNAKQKKTESADIVFIQDWQEVGILMMRQHYHLTVNLIGKGQFNE